ncbi:MAG: YafY family transcriptional regulator [Chloroflexota bacterium]|nr:YafY family transcriptional regulator [Chloroflexota bacterium]
MYHPTTRVLTVLELLQSRSRLSGAELAERLEVDRRTVRRYVTMLQELGVPVESEAGRYGGYRLRPGYKLPPMMFTEEEALALSLGLLVARRLGLAEAAPAVEGALAKLDRVLPDRLRGRVQAVQGALAFTPLRGSNRPSDPTTLLALTTAAQHSRRVHLRYQAAEDLTERDIDPYGVVHHQGRWYVVGWCHLRQDVRMFRLDRIVNVEPRQESFPRPLDFDCVDYVLHSLATVPFGSKVEVLLDLSLDEARRRIAPDTGTLEATPHGVLLRCRADAMDWMARLLVQIGCPVTVIDPPELRDALRALARQVAGYARRGQPQRAAKTSSPTRTMAVGPR